MTKHTLIFISLLISTLSLFAQNATTGEPSDSLAVATDSLANNTTDDEEVYMPMSESEFKQLMEQGTLKSEKKKKKKVSLAIKVIDKSTNNPLKATISITARSKDGIDFEGVGSCDEKGVFQLSLSPDSEVDIVISFPEYLPIRKSFKFKKGKKVKYKVHKKYKLTKLVVGEYIQLKRITFQEGEYKLLESSYKQLATLHTLMEKHPKMKIEIAGHTDNSGSSKYNKKLSQDRADAVKKFLVENGIKKNRIKAVGYGGTKPLVAGNDVMSKKQNRRVEFKITKI